MQGSDLSAMMFLKKCLMASPDVKICCLMNDNNIGILMPDEHDHGLKQGSVKVGMCSDQSLLPPLDRPGLGSAPVQARSSFSGVSEVAL